MTQDSNTPGGKDEENRTILDTEKRLEASELQMSNAADQAELAQPTTDARERVSMTTELATVLESRDQLKDHTGIHLPIEMRDGVPIINLDAAVVTDQRRVDGFDRAFENLGKRKVSRRAILTAIALTPVLALGGCASNKDVSTGVKFLDIVLMGVIALGGGILLANAIRRPNPEALRETKGSVKSQVDAIKKYLEESGLLGDQPYQLVDTDITAGLTQEELTRLWTRFANPVNVHDRVVDTADWLEGFLDGDPDMGSVDDRKEVKSQVITELKKHGLARKRGVAGSAANRHMIRPRDLDPNATEANFSNALDAIVTHLRTMANDVNHANSQRFVTAEQTRLAGNLTKLQGMVDDLAEKRRAMLRDMPIQDVALGGVRGDSVDRRTAMRTAMNWIGGSLAGLSILGLIISRGCSSAVNTPNKGTGWKNPLNSGGGNDGGVDTGDDEEEEDDDTEEVYDDEEDADDDADEVYGDDEEDDRPVRKRRGKGRKGKSSKRGKPKGGQEDSEYERRRKAAERLNRGE